MYLWHCKIGHLSLYIIDFIVHQNAIYELDVFISKEFDYLCNRYTNDKFYYLSLFGSRASQYSKMKLLIMNLTGPISISTWDEYLYVLVVMEVSCYYTVGYLLKTNEKASIVIQGIIAMMEH